MALPTVSRPDDIRRHNLASMLAEVHRDGALTRAELTQRLGLSRSTIGALVADLTALHLVAESVPSGGVRAGRPSHVVGPSSSGPYVVAVDVDVTHTTAAAVAIGGTVLGRHVVAGKRVPPRPDEVVRQIGECVRVLIDEVRPGVGPVGIGVSVPGTVDRHSWTIGVAPNLGWRDTPFGTMLAEQLGDVPIVVGNDADLAVIAEHRRGSARDCDDAIYVLGRVGVGAGMIVNGSPLRGHYGYAGEIGHNVVDASGPLCHCGKRGCLETFVGETALLSLAGSRQPPTAARVAAIFEQARSGKPKALAAVRTFADSTGHMLASLVNMLNPQRIILGGSFADVLDIARAEIEEVLDSYILDRDAGRVDLVPPSLGQDSALLGAAEIALSPLIADPLNGRALVAR